jgi:hypothetical protein
MGDAHVSTDIIVDLEPLAASETKRPGEDRAELATFLGRRNQIRIGAPRCEDYVAHLRGKRRPVPAEVQALIDRGYTFQRVEPSMTVLPDRQCAFISVEFSIALSAEPTQTGGAVEPAVAYHVGPPDIVESDPFSETSKTTSEIGARSDIALAKVLAKISHEDVLKRDGVRAIRRQYSYGRNFSEVGWRLRATPNHELAGDITDLEVVVRVPPNATLTGHFRLVAEIAVQAWPDRWLTATFAPLRDKALAAAYPLSPTQS